MMSRALASALLSTLLALSTAVMAATPPDRLTQQKAMQRYKSGQQLLLSDAFAEAVEEFRAAIALDPSMPLAHYGLGQAYMGLKSYGEAILALRACRGAYEDVNANDLERAQRLDSWIQDEVRALRDLQRQIEARLRSAGAAPNPALQRELSRVSQRADQLERMRGRQDQTAVIPPGVALALGSAYLRSGRLEDAEKEYLAAVSVNPKMGEAHNNLAYVYMVTGRLKDAERALTQAEKSGFKVHPEFKTELKQKLQ
jgi:tetratricopeptide (TPR) repeat protein